MKAESSSDLSDLSKNVDHLKGSSSNNLLQKNKRASPRSSVSKDDCNGRMVYHGVVVGRHMAPHPYARNGPPYRKRTSSSSSTCSKKSLSNVVLREPLKGLVPAQGKTCLPLDDIARIQRLVDPRFSQRLYGEPPRPFLDQRLSESDRKEEILKYLRGDLESISIKSEDEADGSPMECSDNGLLDLTPFTDQTFLLTEIPAENQNIELNNAMKFKGAGSPLSKLEEMKALLPAVEPGGNQVLNVAPVSPASPASSTSSGSSKEHEEEPSKKKKLVAYNGNGQIYLYQYLIESLSTGEHGIAWVNQNTYEFKFTHPDAFARGWGRRKNRPSMTYDKMCRSLRDYYKWILKKVPNHRHVFQFINEDVKRICREMQSVKECVPAVAHSQKPPLE